MEKVIKCVIAEDFEELNTIYSNLLSHEMGIEVTGSAQNGKELFYILENNSVDIVLMDIEMGSPKSGINYCRRISKEFPEIKVIMLTCHEEEDMIVSAFEAGAVDYILKTNSLTEVVNTIRSSFNGQLSIHGYAANAIRKQLKEIGNLKSNLLYISKIISKLTSSELSILKHLINGEKQKQIAKARHIKLVTVKAHVGNILKKFKCHRASEVVKLIKKHSMENFVMEIDVDNMLK